MSTNMTFGVETSTHRPKYRLWLGLYIITLSNYLDYNIEGHKDILLSIFLSAVFVLLPKKNISKTVRMFGRL